MISFFLPGRKLVSFLFLLVIYLRRFVSSSNPNLSSCHDVFQGSTSGSYIRVALAWEEVQVPAVDDHSALLRLFCTSGCLHISFFCSTAFDELEHTHFVLFFSETSHLPLHFSPFHISILLFIFVLSYLVIRPRKGRRIIFYQVSKY